MASSSGEGKGSEKPACVWKKPNNIPSAAPVLDVCSWPSLRANGGRSTVISNMQDVPKPREVPKIVASNPRDVQPKEVINPLNVSQVDLQQKEILNIVASDRSGVPEANLQPRLDGNKRDSKTRNTYCLPYTTRFCQTSSPEVTDVPMFSFVPMFTSDLCSVLKTQIEHYFSDGNLVGDDYLRSKMDDQGFVPVSVIATFPRVRSLTHDVSFILKTLKGSSVVEVRGDKLRNRNNWVTWLPTHVD